MSNTGLLGAAILTLLMGSEAMIYIFVVIIESVFLVPLMLTWLKLATKTSQFSRYLKNNISNLTKKSAISVGMIGMSCAFSNSNSTSVGPSFCYAWADSSPLAFFIIGGGMVGLTIQSLNLQTIYLWSKNICMPILVYLGLTHFTDLDQKMIYAGTLIAALPMPSIFGIFGQIYGLNEKH
jgi:hypothetical protein